MSNSSSFAISTNVSPRVKRDGHIIHMSYDMTTNVRNLVHDVDLNNPALKQWFAKMFKIGSARDYLHRNNKTGRTSKKPFDYFSKDDQLAYKQDMARQVDFAMQQKSQTKRLEKFQKAFQAQQLPVPKLAYGNGHNLLYRFV